MHRLDEGDDSAGKLPCLKYGQRTTTIRALVVRLQATLRGNVHLRATAMSSPSKFTQGRTREAHRMARMVWASLSSRLGLVREGEVVLDVV